VRKILFVLIISITLAIASSVNVFANRNIINNGVIQGNRKVDYQVRIPNSWARYIQAEFENLFSSSGIVEKINFFYVPRNNVNKPQLFMSLFVFNRAEWNRRNTSAFTRVAEDTNYVYAITYNATNPFSNAIDRANYGRLITDIRTAGFVRRMLELSQPLPPVSRTITVNGRVLNTQVVYRDGIAFLPLREICVALGYRVTWNDRDRSINISGRGYNKTFFPDTPGRNSGYRIIIHNGVAYIIPLFFIWDLGASTDIDANDNFVIVR